MSDMISTQVATLLPGMIQTRRDFHKHAEAAWTEFRTASIIAARLTQLGYALTMGADAVSKSHMKGVPSGEALKAHQQRAVEQGADPDMVARMTGGLTGMWADMTFGGGAGPRFALRFDFDANDVQECRQNDHRPYAEGFASVNNGAMHACGHDAHAAVGLAVAELLAGMKDTLKGSIRLIFQAAEEGARGADPMVAAGCVDGVDLLAAMHIGFQAAKKGDIVCGAKGFLATSKWDVRFTGKSAHAGAAPQEGKNALLAASTAILNLHAIPRHGGGDTRITVGTLHAGQGRNVIPPNAYMTMETRGINSTLDEYMVGEAKRIIKAAAEMWGCEYENIPMGVGKSAESDRAMVERVSAVARTMPAFTNIVDMKDFGASEDVSNMMVVVQQRGGLACYIQVGTDKCAGHHNDRFDFDETDLATSAELFVRLVQDYLSA